MASRIGHETIATEGIVKQFGLLLLLLPCIAFGRTHYVTTTGTLTSGNASTVDSAWTLGYALGSQNSANGTADTIFIEGGRYDVKALGSFYPAGVQMRVHGSPTAQLVIRGELVRGIPATFITENDSVHGLICALGGYVTYQDLVLENTFANVNPSHYGGSLFTPGNNDGIPIPGLRLINVVARDAMVTGFADNSEGVGIRYEWCMAYYNGKKVDNSNFGYGLYGQNGLRGGYKHYIDNILWDNWGRNTQMYGSSATHVDSIHYSNCTFFQYPNTTDANCMVDMTDGDGTLDDAILDSCYFWTESVNGWGRTWRESNATARAKYRGNWMVKGTMYGSPNSVARVMTGNRYWGPASPDNISTSAYPDNVWSVGGGDLTNAPMPAWADTCILRVSPYHSGLGHLIVYNRTGGASKAWNPSGFVSAGDSLLLYDVQNLFGGPVLAVKYAGGAVNFPMNLTAIEQPICKPAAKGTLSHTDSRFGAFLLYAVRGSAPAEPPPVVIPPPPSVPAPVITKEPASVTKSIQTTFSVSATGTGKKYQWQRNGASIPGATEASYSTGPLTLADNGAQFRCIVTNAGGSDTSAVAVLTVK